MMKLISEGIDKIRAVELPAGIWSGGKYFGCHRFALVKWQSSWTDKFHQVYVDGSFAGGTVSVNQRQLVVPLPAAFETAVAIEVFATEQKDAHLDCSNELSENFGTAKVKLRLLRSQDLPIGSTVQIYFDNATGVIDYDNPLNAEPIRVWPDRYDKAGFGMTCFAECDFGFDSAPAVGFGLGDFGLGLSGVDADSIEWVSEPLARGVYKFAAKVTDGNGNVSDATETEPQTVIPAATPAESLDIVSFDKLTNELLLSVN